MEYNTRRIYRIWLIRFFYFSTVISFFPTIFGILFFSWEVSEKERGEKPIPIINLEYLNEHEHWEWELGCHNLIAHMMMIPSSSIAHERTFDRIHSRR